MNLRFTLLFFLLGIMVLSGCRSQRGTIQTGTVFERGEASWYGPGFHGQATANGERYDQEALTAAHRTLPFDTVVGVRNLRNGKTVVVRINDRGPFANNRIIDLSRAAAREIDMIQSGIAPVELTILRSPVPVQRAAIARELFTVQVASFNTRQEAAAYARSIRGARVAEGRVQGRTVFRVYVGEFRNQRDAERQRRRLSRQGINGFVKQVQN